MTHQKNNVARILLVVVASLAASCGDGREPGARSVVDPVNVSIQPPDLTSRVRGGPIEVSLRRNGPAIPDSVVNETAATIRVLAGGTEVPATLEILPPPDPHDVPFAQRTIRVTVADWGTDWLEVRVTPNPHDAVCNLRSLVPTEVPGACRARLHPDSAPVLQYVELCSSPKTGLKGIVAFSEDVVLNARNASALTLRLASSTCTPFLGSGVAEDDVESPPPPDTTAVVAFACPGATLEDPTVEFGSLRGVDGKTVTALGHGETRLVFDQTTAWHPEHLCLRWNL